MTKRRFVLVCAVCAVVAMLLSDCGAAATPTAVPPTSVPPAAATPVPPPPTPVPPTPVPPTATALPPTPTTAPTKAPTVAPPAAPTVAPTAAPTVAPTTAPTKAPVPTVVPTATPTETVEVPRPSNPGGPGPAINLTGDVKNGIAVFNSKAQDKNCATCHGPEGKGNVPNPGSNDGTVPPLNPIDELLKDKDPKVFATNIDLFIEHGSTPEGPNPQLTMPAWGDEKRLSPQEIADVIAYVMSLNP
jgi:mono/diheme cytochrome c family protein